MYIKKRLRAKRLHRPHDLRDMAAFLGDDIIDPVVSLPVGHTVAKADVI